MLCPTRHSHERETSLLERLAGGEADGAVLVLPEESAAELRALAAHGFPFVVVDPRTEVPDGIPVVCAAHSSGATQATRHLLSLGHRRIGVIGGPRGLGRDAGAAARLPRGAGRRWRPAGRFPRPVLELPHRRRPRAGGGAA